MRRWWGLSNTGQRRAKRGDQGFLGGLQRSLVDMSPVALIKPEGFPRRQFLEPLSHLPGQTSELRVIIQPDSDRKLVAYFRHRRLGHSGIDDPRFQPENRQSLKP